MRIVISQSMYFPWVGLLEQIRSADAFVHYDDVQFSKGSFTNRVQIKTPSGTKWLTIPLEKYSSTEKIDQIKSSSSVDWKSLHIRQLFDAYRFAEYKNEMLSIVEDVFSKSGNKICDISRFSTKKIAEYFSIDSDILYVDSNLLNIGGGGSDRVLETVKHFHGTHYITGHGARNYLDHEKFEVSGVDVMYMDYKKLPYPQLHGTFTPYVSALDLIANCGKQGRQFICSTPVTWRIFLNEHK